MIRIQIQGVNEVLADYRNIREDQIPFALALSLTRTAQLVQKTIREELDLKFELRRRAWIASGVKIDAATKRRPEATVKDVDPFMDLQEMSGEKRAGLKYKVFTYKGMVCIPLTRGVASPRRRHSALIRPDQYPQAIMDSGRGFIRNNIMYQRGAHYARPHKFLRVRGPGAAMVDFARDKISAMYALVPAWEVKKRWNFVQRAQQIVEAEWPAQFDQAFKDAVASSDLTDALQKALR